MNRAKKIILIMCCFFIVISGILYMNSNNIGKYISERNESNTEVLSIMHGQNKMENNENDSMKMLNDESKNTKVVVYICGAVNKPGVYKFDTGSRVYDAVKAAKGFKKGAAKTAINQARLLEDGEQINILTLKQLKRNSSNKKNTQAKSGDSSKAGLVNINTASVTELTSLSGIGQSRADAIIEYRETNGKFKDISDLMKISGIKDGIFNKIKDKISV